jgi:hypothetical protein
MGARFFHPAPQSVRGFWPMGLNWIAHPRENDCPLRPVWTDKLSEEVDAHALLRRQSDVSGGHLALDPSVSPTLG